MWKFQEFLNADIAIMLVMLAGAASVWRNLIFRREDLRVFNLFLFKATLPASVIMGLGLKTDLYSEEIWRFVGAFLMMRAIMLVACALLFGLVLRRSLGEVTANWLSTTWISTVILGVPLLRALLGPKYAPLGVVAGISSFIFQLPVMLILFEVHTWRQESLASALPQTQPGDKALAPPPSPPIDGTEQEVVASKPGDEPLPGSCALGSAGAQRVHPEGRGHGSSPGAEPAAGVSTAASWLQFKMTRKQGQRLGLRLIMNHVLWGVGIGIVLSLSKIGPKWLDPGTPPAAPNCTYAVGAGFIYLLLEYFSRCTEPVAFFSTGMWMVRPRPLAIGWWRAALYMLVKLVLVPLLMVGCCFAVGLEAAYARAAVLVAMLPVSAAAFALSKTYNIGEDVAVANVFLGNLLILPTTIAWLEVMDAIGLFTASFGKVPPTCTNPCLAPAG